MAEREERNDESPTEPEYVATGAKGLHEGRSAVEPIDRKG